MKTAVEAMITIEQAKKGEQLLTQLCHMSPDDIDKLSDLLKDWDIDDILAVINEIDKRISVVEAISRIFDDKDTDELHTLHPLVLNARWLFGPEFDSPMFVSNSALTTVVKRLFRDEDYDLSEIANPRKRPDIVCLKTSTLKAVCTDRIDNDANGVMKPDQVLIVELKRGGFTIEANEVSQAEHYVRQIKKSAVLHKSAEITAFVVGATISMPYSKALVAKVCRRSWNRTCLHPVCSSRRHSRWRKVAGSIGIFSFFGEGNIQRESVRSRCFLSTSTTWGGRIKVRTLCLVFGSETTTPCPITRLACLLILNSPVWKFRSSHWRAASSPSRSPVANSRRKTS